MANNLIYTVAFNEWWRKCARALVRSLREAGFVEEIIVLCDELDRDIEDEGCRVVRFNLGLLDITGHSRHAHCATAMSRYYLHTAVEINPYDTITYLDADILVHPKADLSSFDPSTLDPVNRFATEIQMIGDSKYTMFTSDAMDEETIERFKDRKAINAGSWTVGVDYYEHMSRGVREIFSAIPVESDQAVLNAFLYTNYDSFPWSFYPRGFVEHVSNVTNAELNKLVLVSALVHYNGRSSELLAELKRRYPDIGGA